MLLITVIGQTGLYQRMPIPIVARWRFGNSKSGTQCWKKQCGAYRDEAAPEVSDGLRSLLCWDYESEKMSFVLTNREVYDRMVETLENIKFKDVFSLILVNLDENKVEEEYVFPLVGRPNVGTVFTPIEDVESKAEEDTVEESESDWEQKLFDI